MRVPVLQPEYANVLDRIIEYKKALFAQAQEVLISGGGMDMLLIQYTQDLGTEIAKLEIEVDLLRGYLEQ